MSARDTGLQPPRRKSLTSDVGGFIGLVEIAFSCSPDYRLLWVYFFFPVNKHLSNNEQTNNVLREKKNILFLFFFFFFAVSSENRLDLETHIGHTEYESWRFLLQGVVLPTGKQSALAKKRHTGDVKKRQVSGHFSTEDLGEMVCTASFWFNRGIAFQYVVFPVDALAFLAPLPCVLLLSPLFCDVRITFSFKWCLDLIQCYHCIFFSLLGTVLGERFWGKKAYMHVKNNKGNYLMFAS